MMYTCSYYDVYMLSDNVYDVYMFLFIEVSPLIFDSYMMYTCFLYDVYMFLYDVYKPEMVFL